MLELILFALSALNTSDDWKAKLPPISGSVEIIDPAKVPIKDSDSLEPKLLEEKSVAVWAQDLDSGKKLYEKNSLRPQHIASLSKILTFLIIWEEHELNEIVSVPLTATQAIGAQIGLYQYEKITVGTLLEAILIPSANDAALALALHNSGSEIEFAKKMNQYAKKYGLRSAKFHNSTGLDIRDAKTGEFYGNMMSAADVAKLTKLALKNKFFRTTVAKPEFFGTSVDQQFAHSKKSTNQLFGSFVGTKGVKTGYTELAGQCLVHLSEREDGVEILSVVLGSPDRFQETKNLLTWLWDNFVWR